MIKRAARSHRSQCAISRSLDVLGDRWTLLIVRDLLFAGLRSYGDFLTSGDGIATNILAARLEILETAGIIKSKADPTDGRKLIYRLTPKGTELAPILLELGTWGIKYEGGTRPKELSQRWEVDPKGLLAALANNHSR
ncbi:MAG TPA: helix-turn-helix domain-containing protein [Steroidobacteraceae bacterium]